LKIPSSSVQETERSVLIKDERFLNLVKRLESDIRGCEPLFLISCLKALQELGVPTEEFAVKNLENAVLWVSRSCSIKELVMGFSFMVNRSTTPEHKHTLDELCKIIERRWVEFQEGWHFTVMLRNSAHLSPDLLAKLEDRLQDSVHEVPVSELVNILSCYAKLGRRNIPVLRSVGFHIAKNRAFLDLKEISDVLYAFNKLSFKDQETIEKICFALEPLITDDVDNRNVRRSIITSLGQLKFVHPEVLDRVCDYYDSRLKENKLVDSRDLSTLVITLANLNHIPFDKENFFQTIESKLKYEDMKDLPRGNSIWVDIVWSLLVLKRSIATKAPLILEPSFIKALKDSDSLKRCASKILNLNEAVVLLGKEYSGPQLSISDIEELTQLLPTPSGPKIKFKKFVMETLSTLFPPPRFAHEDTKTRFGVNLDVEVIADKNSKALEVEPYATKINPTSSPKDLPTGASRVAILIVPFQESLIGGGMTGSTSLACRLLQANGFVTLVVDSRTLDSSMKAISRIQKLDVLIKQILEKKSLS